MLASTSEGVPAQAGSWLAWLDGYGSAHTDTLAQKVTIPANCKNAVFTYWVEVNSTTTNKKQHPGPAGLELLGDGAPDGRGGDSGE